MNAREFLTRPETLRRQIEQKRYRIETLRRLAESAPQALREIRVCASPDPARMQSLLAEAAEEEQGVRLLEEELSRALTEVILAVSALPEPRLSRVLELRYLDSLPWEEISLRMNLCQSVVFRLHRRALPLLPLPPGEP